ncbi:MAG: hypothetical protein LBL59_04300 [Xanthomonadaceae bacterium]|nr:hypothetical protein [Xanthomonadaceae bacterium]
MNDYPALNAFPSGALRVDHTGSFSGIPMLLMMLALALCGLGVLALGTPGILQDWKISKNPASVYADVGGECKTRLVLTHCDVTLNYRHQGKPVAVDRHFFFFDFGGGSYQVQALSLDGDRSKVTLDLAIDKLYNRIIFLLLAGAFFFAGAWGTMVNYRRARPLSRFGKGKTAQLRPVVVTLPQKSSIKGLTYKWVAGGQTRLFFTKFTKKENGPFVLGANDNKTFDALAVVPQGSDVAILLDDALTRVQLAEDQKQALYKAREA